MINKNIFKKSPQEYFKKYCIPWLGADNDLEIFKQYGYTYTGICDGFDFYENKLIKASEIDLYKMLAFSNIYWNEQYKKWYQDD